MGKHQLLSITIDNNTFSLLFENYQYFFKRWYKNWFNLLTSLWVFESNSCTTMSRKVAVSGHWIKSRNSFILRHWLGFWHTRIIIKKLFLFFHVVLFGIRELLWSIIAVVLKSLTCVMSECCFKHCLKFTIINLFF